MTAIKIFDIDGVLLDSSHRQSYDSKGRLDLEYWRTHSTPEKIAQDKPLPLAKLARNAIKSGQIVIACTSRVISEADRQVLKRHTGITVILCRDGEKDTRPDAVLKTAKLSEWLKNNQIARPDKVAFFDDLPANVRAAKKLGLRAVKVTPPKQAMAHHS